MTTVKILTESQGEGVKKPIEFVYLLNNGSEQIGATAEPSMTENIVLIAKDRQQLGYDLMFSYNNNCEQFGCLYLGHFNDGIVI
jgi:hypothetical protein